MLLENTIKYGGHSSTNKMFKIIVHSLYLKFERAISPFKSSQFQNWNKLNMSVITTKHIEFGYIKFISKF